MEDYNDLKQYNDYLLSYRRKAVTCEECYLDGFEDASFNYKRTLEEIKRLVEKIDGSVPCEYNTYDCDNCKMFSCQAACNYGIKKYILDLIAKKQNKLQKIKERE